MEISVDKVNIDLEMGTAIITGYDINEIISEIGLENILEAIDYSDVIRYVERVDQENADDDYDFSTANKV